MLAPVWAQLTHLLLANLVWIGLVLLGAAVLSRPDEVYVTSEKRHDEAERQVINGVPAEGEEVAGWSNRAPSAL
jgi:hypothetical protein